MRTCGSTWRPPKPFRPLLESAVARCPARIPDPLRPFRVRHPHACRPVRPERLHGVALPSARRHRAPVRVSRRSGPGAPRSALAPRCDGLRRVRVLAHPRRQRSPTVLVLPGNSVPAAAAPRHHRNSFHRRAFDFSDRLGLRLCPGCALVPAAHRNVDRGDDHLHGAGKHRLCGTWNVWWRHFAALDHRLRVRPGARLRLFLQRCASLFAGNHLMTALFGFNIGVEIGQIAVLLVLIPALDLLFRYVIAEWLGVIILSALIAHVAWHWMIERGERLAKFPFPKIDVAFLGSAMRGLMAMLIVALAVLLANSWLKRWIQSPKISPAKDVIAKRPASPAGLPPKR